MQLMLFDPGSVSSYLEIQVSDPLRMHVFQSAQDLLDEKGRICLADVILFGHKLKQLSTSHAETSRNIVKQRSTSI